MKQNKILFVVILFLFACEKKVDKNNKDSLEEIKIEYKEKYIASEFDLPVGKKNSKKYYNAQKFKENFHLGEDWNAVTGGNSDLGDPIFAVANGYVKFARDYKGGWGNVIRIVHKLPNGKSVESLYAHCDSIFVKEKMWVKKGVQIATIGKFILSLISKCK